MSDSIITTSDGKVWPPELLEKLEQVCRRTPPEHRDSSEEIKLLRTQLYDQSLTLRHMSQLKALESQYNLA